MLSLILETLKSYFKLTNYKEAYTTADIVVFLVAHSVFKSLVYDDKKIIIDFCGIYKK